MWAWTWYGAGIHTLTVTTGMISGCIVFRRIVRFIRMDYSFFLNIHIQQKQRILEPPPHGDYGLQYSALMAD